MKKFFKAIDYRSRKQMSDFLKNHFRYATTSNCARSTSYANDMKIYKLDLTEEQLDKLYDLVGYEEAYETINFLLDDFEQEYGYEWQANFNGRCGGYLVLYKGGLKDTGYKSVCTSCGQQNFRSTKETGCVCGRCGESSRVDYQKPIMRKYTSVEGVDERDDLEEWTLEELRDRCKLVQRFDVLCDEIVEEAVRLSEKMEIVEETELVPVTRKVLMEVE